ncbi:hypothetical protein [Paracoccus sp. (in: a-proteobacteria)]|uniref:hypothetical protein n=1 Tax=Paracoccus sp. TaxID=267 RepID=UPI0040591A44
MYLLVFIQNLLVHLAEKILLCSPLLSGGLPPAWIEWLIASPTGDKLADHLPEQADWLVPTMVQLELAKWLTREIGEDKADQVIAFTQICHIVPLDTESRGRSAPCTLD